MTTLRTAAAASVRGPDSAPASPKPRVFVAPLDEIGKPEARRSLPPLCRLVHDRLSGADGGRPAACERTCTYLDRLISSLTRAELAVCPLCCCAYGGKKFAFADAANQAYVAFCRSPFYDRSHMEKVADECDVPIDDVRARWALFPRFSEQFVRDAFRIAEKDYGATIPRDTFQDGVALGGCYAQFGLDVTTYNSLDRLPSPPGDAHGHLRVLLVSRANADRELVFRMVTRQFDAGDSAAPPVVAVRAPAESDDRGPEASLNAAFESPRASAVLASATPDGQEKELDAEDGAGMWKARIRYAVTKVLPETPEWAETVRLYCAAMAHNGTNTAPARLLDDLPPRGEGGDLKNFKHLLELFRRPEFHAELNGSGPAVNRAVFGDLHAALHGLGWPNEPSAADGTRDVLEYLAVLPAFTPAPRFDTAEEQEADPRRAALWKSRREALNEDLRRGSRDYLLLLTELTIPAAVFKDRRERRRWGFNDPELIEELTRWNSKAVFGVLLYGTREGLLPPASEMFRHLWGSYFMARPTSSPDRTNVADEKYELYKTIAPADVRKRNSRFAGRAGVLHAACTPWRPMSAILSRTERDLAVKYVDSLLRGTV